VGSANILATGALSPTTNSATANGLPTNGATVYVRLYSLINGSWLYTDYTYKAE
jgi:hypothetical protein